MPMKTIKFYDIPAEISILRLFNFMNRQFHIQVNEYKGVGFVKREVADKGNYNLVVEFRKDYLISKLLSGKLQDNNKYKLVVDNHNVYFNLVGMKYLICETKNGSKLKDRILMFKTLDNQNVLDVVAKVVGKVRMDIEYVISNKNSSYLAMTRNIDATQLMALLKQQNYHVIFSKIYHEFSYFEDEEQVEFARSIKPKFYQQNVKFHPYKQTKRSGYKFKTSSADKELKELKVQLANTNKQIREMMNERKSKEESTKAQINEDRQQQQQMTRPSAPDNANNFMNNNCQNPSGLPYNFNYPMYNSTPRMIVNPSFLSQQAGNIQTPNTPFVCYFPF